MVDGCSSSHDCEAGETCFDMRCVPRGSVLPDGGPIDASVSVDDAGPPAAYCPEASVTRGEAARVILRAALGLDYVPAPATAALCPAGTALLDWTEALATAGYDTSCSAIGTADCCPDALLTRAIAAVWILRLAYGVDYVPPDVAASSFGDVDVTHPQHDWIEAFYATGITSGCGTSPEGKPLYCPDAPLGRSGLAVFVEAAIHPGIEPTAVSGTGTFCDDDGIPHEAWIELLASDGLAEPCAASCP